MASNNGARRDDRLRLARRGAARNQDLQLLAQSISTRRKDKPFLIVALNTGLTPGRKSARIVCFDITQPDPYVWKGDDAAWENLFRSLPAELEAGAVAAAGHGPIRADCLGSLDVFHTLEDAISKREPFSLLRIGDGEGYVLGYEDTTTDQEIGHILNMWFGIHTISRKDILDIRFGLADAILDCDVIGLHNRSDIHEKFRRSVRTIARHGLWHDGKPICSAEIHMQLHQENLFSPLLQGLDFVGIITPRVVERMMSETWNIKEVVRYGLPEEYHYATDGTRIGRHYPDRFREIMRDLEVPYRGAVFLVGAGVLGKIYCKRIKDLGGIAIDIGSTFDAWGSHARRGNVKKMRLGL